IDWDGNGTVDQAVTGVSGTQVTHAFTATGPSTLTVSAADPAGSTSQAATAAVTVSANQPAAGVGGPAAGTAGLAMTFTLTANEAYAAAAANYGYRIDWGDGSAAQTVAGPSGTAV